jgi:hypothetical protein
MHVLVGKTLMFDFGLIPFYDFRMEARTLPIQPVPHSVGCGFETIETPIKHLRWLWALLWKEGTQISVFLCIICCDPLARIPLQQATDKIKAIK